MLVAGRLRRRWCQLLWGPAGTVHRRRVMPHRGVATGLRDRLLSLAAHHRDPAGVGQPAAHRFLLREHRRSLRDVRRQTGLCGQVYHCQKRSQSHYHNMRLVQRRLQYWTALLNKTRLPSNLRPTTRECVHLVRHGHFRSRDKDGGYNNRFAVAANFMAPCFIEP